MAKNKTNDLPIVGSSKGFFSKLLTQTSPDVLLKAVTKSAQPSKVSFSKAAPKAAPVPAKVANVPPAPVAKAPAPKAATPKKA